MKNPYHSTAFGVGYIGSGKYKGGKHGSKAYQYWYGMIRRCYSNEYLDKNPSYSDCYVCDEWLNFQNFAMWFNDNYYEIPDHIMNLDKDVLISGNKIYSPDTCCFIPNNINMLFRPEDFEGRYGHPPGVKQIKGSKKHKYEAKIRTKGSDVHIGTFDTWEEAYNAYKAVREKIVKDTAEKYKDVIPDKVYRSMIQFALKEVKEYEK